MKLTHLFLFGSWMVFAAACGDGSGGSGGGGSTSTAGAGGTTASGGSTSTGGTSTGGTSTGGTTTGGAGGCHSSSDCENPDYCVAYMLPPLCGGVEDSNFDQACDTDAQCMNGDICVDTLCVFPHGGAPIPLHCRPGCTADADCGVAMACDADHHCVAKNCQATGECGSDNFICDGVACVAKACTMDSECANYCVNGSCSAIIGVCQPALP